MSIDELFRARAKLLPGFARSAPHAKVAVNQRLGRITCDPGWPRLQFAMLAYRHAFHAGNHADVLKQVVLAQVLRHMAAEGQALLARRHPCGRRRLCAGGREAQKKAEFERHRADVAGARPAARGGRLPGARARVQWRGRADQYPGSPGARAGCCARPDRLRLYELHPDRGRSSARTGSAAAHQGDDGRRLRGDQERVAAAVAPRRGADRPVVRAEGRLRQVLGGRARGAAAFCRRRGAGLVPAAATMESAQLPKRLAAAAHPRRGAGCTRGSRCSRPTSGASG